MLSDRTLSICDVGVLWPNGWRIRTPLFTEVGLGQATLLDGYRTVPSRKGAQQPLLLQSTVARVYSGQTAGWIRVPLATQVGVGQGDIFSERELTFTFAICCRPSVCLSSVCRLSVCNARAPYSGGSTFRQYLYGIWYTSHPLTSTENFTEIVPGEPLRRGS